MSTEPQIRYAKTPDGLSIAYYAVGEGPALVYMPPTPFTHVELEWKVSELREGMEAVARAATWVRYDERGFGLSSRDNVTFSLEAAESDLAIVVDALGLERFALMATAHEAIPAVAYAAHHPERVGALVLWIPVVDGTDVLGGRSRSLLTMARTDWRMFVETIAATTGWDRWATSREFVQLIDAAMTQETTIAYYEWVATTSARDLLPQLTAPTLVLGRRESTFLPPEYFGRVAADLPNAVHRTLEGSSQTLTDPQAGAAIADFLAPIVVEELARRTSTSGPTTPPSAFRTILFTDIVGHTEMMQRLGDAKGRDVLREHERITRDLLKQHGGIEKRTDGDGFMASFGSVTSAMECAIALQRAFNAWNDDVGAQRAAPLHVRVGLNAGEPIEEDGDLFGATVILASRIAARAGPGEILVPDTVRGLLSGKGFMFSDRGEFVPKGFDDAVRLYEVRWRD